MITIIIIIIIISSSSSSGSGIRIIGLLPVDDRHPALVQRRLLERLQRAEQRQVAFMCIYIYIYIL